MRELESKRRSPARPLRRRGESAAAQAGHEALALAASLRAASNQWGGVLRRGMRRNPYATLGAAAGAGYVLAGGLAPAAVRVAFAAGWRIAATALLRELMGSIAADDPDADL